MGGDHLIIGADGLTGSDLPGPQLTGMRSGQIVIGFFMGVTFNWVVGHWINVTIMPAHNIQNSDTWMHLTQIGGLLLVFSGLHLFAAYKSFSLTWELPNAILRWMGIQDHQDLGEREGKENIMALGMAGGKGMSPIMAGGKEKPDDPDKGKGGGKEPNKLNGDKGGESDPNTDKTPPGAGPGGAPNNTKPEGEG
ncbi:hypothetical protein [Venatoribacter cucullus]|uniref:hypothetical protein n=1 Tax=Venatoribacter cucullus TaxID=2661630 RepID=UPI00223F9A38|nr:hypothetical protein [Venatoribacter cucullus]